MIKLGYTLFCFHCLKHANSTIAFLASKLGEKGMCFLLFGPSFGQVSANKYQSFWTDFWWTNISSFGQIFSEQNAVRQVLFTSYLGVALSLLYTHTLDIFLNSRKTTLEVKNQQMKHSCSWKLWACVILEHIKTWRKIERSF